MALLLSLLFTLSLLSIQASGLHLPDSIIIGGEEAKPGEIPYQGAIYTGGLGCGASIYNEGWAITAAHCYQSNVQLLVGSVNVNDHDENAQLVDVEEFITHPNADIALLKLKTKLKFNEFVQPIEIPPQGYLAETEFLVSGWGTTDPWFARTQRASHDKGYPDVLRKVKVPFVTDEVCQDAYGGGVLDEEVCAGDMENGGVDSCQGDSGGPLVEIKTGYMAGVVARGAGCARPGYPGIYTETAYYTDWIKETVEKHS